MLNLEETPTLIIILLFPIFSLFFTNSGGGGGGGKKKKEEDNQKEVLSFQIQGKKKKRGLNLSLWEPATTYASRRFPAKYFQRAEA